MIIKIDGTTIEVDAQSNKSLMYVCWSIKNNLNGASKKRYPYNNYESAKNIELLFLEKEAYKNFIGLSQKLLPISHIDVFDHFFEWLLSMS